MQKYVVCYWSLFIYAFLSTDFFFPLSLSLFSSSLIFFYRLTNEICCCRQKINLYQLLSPSLSLPPHPPPLSLSSSSIIFSTDYIFFHLNIELTFPVKISFTVLHEGNIDPPISLKEHTHTLSHTHTHTQ